MIHLNYRDTRPIYSQIFDGFREQISAGILQQGEKLPSVRELATQLTINPNTIQRAYRDLESEGWIVSVPGKGSFVAIKQETGEKEELLELFDTTTARLLSLGVTRAALVARVEKGGNENA